MAVLATCLPHSAAAGFSCPVTGPTALTFKPHGAFAGQASHLLGSEKLFTVFPGNWQLSQKQEHSYRIPKIVWGSNTFDLTKEPGLSSLAITGRRLDAASAPLQFHDAHTAWAGKDYFITSEFAVPTLGCWEVTGHFHDAELTIVVDLK